LVGGGGEEEGGENLILCYATWLMYRSEMSEERGTKLC
jgi:hypothetical protein